MTIEEIENKKNELREQINKAQTTEELEELKEQVEQISSEVPEEPSKDENSEEISKEEERKLLKDTDLNVEKREMNNLKEVREERKQMEEKELRNSAKYIDAYAEMIKTGKDEQIRSLLTENASDGTIAVPDFIYDVVKTAWDKEQIMSLVRKAELKGNLKINFEISGTDAVIHNEGSGPVAEEELVEGIVTIVPKFIKKWISISDEVMSLRGEAFLRYIYAELTYKIVKKAADTLVGMIAALPAVATSTSTSAKQVTLAPATDTIAQAVANLSDEAINPVIIMNKLTYADFKKVQYANNYGVDVFEGLRVLFNNSLPAYSAASANAVYAIVGDLGEGALANMPNGNGVEFKFDELSRKKEDLVEILGKQYVGLGIIADKAFTNIKKPAGV